MEAHRPAREWRPARARDDLPLPETDYPQIVAYVGWFDHTRSNAFSVWALARLSVQSRDRLSRQPLGPIGQHAGGPEVQVETGGAAAMPTLCIPWDW